MAEKSVLTSSRDFDLVYSKGKRAFDRYVVVFALLSRPDRGRVSCVASKKVGNSVRRNRARRLIKESLRHIDVNLSGYDVVIVAKNSINGKKMADVKRSVESAFRKLELARAGNGGRDGFYKDRKKGHK